GALTIRPKAVAKALVPDCDLRIWVFLGGWACDPDRVRLGDVLARDIAADGGRGGIDPNEVAAVSVVNLVDEAVHVRLNSGTACSSDRVAFDVEIDDAARDAKRLICSHR